MIGRLRKLSVFQGVEPMVARALAQLEQNVDQFAEEVRGKARRRWDFANTIITSADSPYFAKPGEFLLIDTTTANVVVQLPKPDAGNLCEEVNWREVAGANNVICRPVEGEVDGAASATHTTASGRWVSFGAAYGWRSL